MSTISKQQPAQPARPVVAASVKKTTSSNQIKKEQTFLFDRENYIMMASGIALIFIGFLLMSGGRSEDPTKFNYDAIYSFSRITLSPILIFIGYIVEVLAIMKKPKEIIAEQVI